MRKKRRRRRGRMRKGGSFNLHLNAATVIHTLHTSSVPNRPGRFRPIRPARPIRPVQANQASQANPRCARCYKRGLALRLRPIKRVIIILLMYCTSNETPNTCMPMKTNMIGIGFQLLVCQPMAIQIEFCCILSDEVSHYIIKND